MGAPGKLAAGQILKDRERSGVKTGGKSGARSGSRTVVGV
jgi:hypothetical protein